MNSLILSAALDVPHISETGAPSSSCLRAASGSDTPPAIFPAILHGDSKPNRAFKFLFSSCRALFSAVNALYFSSKSSKEMEFDVKWRWEGVGFCNDMAAAFSGLGKALYPKQESFLRVVTNVFGRHFAAINKSSCNTTSNVIDLSDAFVSWVKPL